jgi:hypothetical protein
VAEHDADREPQPIDEDAAWAAIVAGYGEEPADPPGAKPFKSVDDLAVLESERNKSTPDGPDAGPPAESGSEATGQESAAEPDTGDDKPSRGGGALGGSIVFAPGIVGPRDYEPSVPEEGKSFDDEDDEDDEGHFVPPEPPSLPESDATAKFAWLGVIGGPVLFLASILLQWDMTWWLSAVCIGGFLGGFATLVGRMRSDDEEDDDPGRGAVV